MPRGPARILLIYPPSRMQTHGYPPMGMMMLAAVLENAGHTLRLLDANAGRKKRNIDEIVQIAEEFKPDVIGMTLLTLSIQEAYRLASALAARGGKLLAGGPHATLLPEEALSHGFDAVVLGEGEPVIEDAVRALLGHVPKDNVRGWVYKDSDGQAVHTESRPPVARLDELPTPARHLIEPLDYAPPGNSALFGRVLGSRGCSAKCTFCSKPVFGKRVRLRSAENILKEVIYVHRTYGTRHFRFMDYTITANRAHVKSICDGLLQSNMNITWETMTRIDVVDEEILTLLARAGCRSIEYGVESGHPETLRRIRKQHTVEMARRVIPMTARLGIKPLVFFILGFPWEDTDAIENTRQLIVDLLPFVERFPTAAGSIVVPFPGTEIYVEYKEQYKLENWWLNPERNHDALSARGLSYCDSRIFPNGPLLDADFFHYTDEVKGKIRDVLKFVNVCNREGASRISPAVGRLLLNTSQSLFSVSPLLERLLFAPVTVLERANRRFLRA